MRRMVRTLLVAAALAAAARPGNAQQGLSQGTRDALPPAGFGSLKQDDIAVKLQNLGLTIKAIPLDESAIRLLAPDSYRALHAQRESRAKELAAIASRMGLPRVQAWLVTYYTLDQGEARFDATDVVLRTPGRDYRPLEVIALTPSFSSGRVAQKAAQQALYAFDPSVDLTQPLTVLAAGQQSTAWTDVQPVLDSERSAIWSRASAPQTKKP